MGKKIIETADAPHAIGPYSQAVQAGDFLYVSGQIPIDPKTGNIVTGDIKVQARMVLDNASAILASAGYGMQDVVKSTIYLKNLADFADLNEVYALYFPSAPPARATVEVSGLPKDAGVEMDFIAWKG